MTAWWRGWMRIHSCATRPLAGAEHIHGHMEEWLQTEWWDWQVYVANVTEQWAQIAVVGPNARKVLEKLSEDDLSAERCLSCPGKM